jgi:hypothetical protein
MERYRNHEKLYLVRPEKQDFPKFLAVPLFDN